MAAGQETPGDRTEATDESIEEAGKGRAPVKRQFRRRHDVDRVKDDRAQSGRAGDDAAEYMARLDRLLDVQASTSTARARADDTEEATPIASGVSPGADGPEDKASRW